MLERETIIVDIDGTLAYHKGYADHTDANWSWDEFEEQIKEAYCNTHLRYAISEAKKAGQCVVILTARPFFLYEETKKWLDDCEVPYDYLMLSDEKQQASFEAARKGGGYALLQVAQAEYKARAINKFRKNGHKILVAYEDNSIMAQAIRNAGVYVHKCRFEG